MTDDFLAMLDAEIDKTLAKSNLASKAEAAKRKANNTSLPSGIRAAASKEFHETQALLEAEQWGAVSSIALFAHQSCDSCGSVHKTFLQYMEEQVLLRRTTTRRFLRVAGPNPILPKRIMAQTSTTHICSDCCSDFGFHFNSEVSFMQMQTPLAPSPSYEQEDLNAQTEED